MVMYGVYNAETLEKLIKTVQHIHNYTSPNEKLFAGQQGTGLHLPMFTNTQGIHYSINTLLYLRIVKEKYVLMYKESITQLHIYATAIRILAKGVPTHLTHYSTDIERNSKHNKKHSQEDKSRL